jgi:NADPH:quinone reductase-like Zn-dependent oxidoreductase
VAKGDIQTKIPDNLSFQEAATLGVGLTTVGQSLYQSLELAPPTEPIQDAVSILTTCSPHNYKLVRSRGADMVFDYNEHHSATKIRRYTQNSLELALDTIAIEYTAQYCVDALSTEGGKYITLNYVAIPQSNIRDRWTLSYTAFGEKFIFGPTRFPAKPKDKEFMEQFWSIAERLVAEGKIKVHPLRVRAGGLKGLLEGLQLMRKGKVSGEKLVYNHRYMRRGRTLGFHAESGATQ